MKESDPIQDGLGWSPEPWAPPQPLGSFAVEGSSKASRLVAAGVRVPCGTYTEWRNGTPLEPLEGAGGEELALRFPLPGSPAHPFRQVRKQVGEVCWSREQNIEGKPVRSFSRLRNVQSSSDPGAGEGARSWVPSRAAWAADLGLLLLLCTSTEAEGFSPFQIWFAGEGVWLYQSTNIYP